MNKDKIDYINKLIDEVRVVSYSENSVNVKGEFLKLKEGNYILNNGNSIRRESVISASSYSFAVCIFSITVDKKILLVVQPRVSLPTDDKVSIELPAGYVEAFEDILVAARRELLEETGYLGHDFVVIDEYYPSLGVSGEKISIVLATGCKYIQKQNLDSDEFVKYFMVDIDEFKYLLDNGFIIDATTRIAYYRTLDYLFNNGLLDAIGR